MSVIIRLQNLPWSANALDIRQFFSGLSIPEGGVHIVGGELGDAFIAFSTDEDARQAFNLNGGKIKEVQIKLMLSSRTEMQKVIEAARNPLAAFMQAAPVARPLPAMIPAAIPAIVPEVKKDDSNKDKEKRDRRRSRSRSRDRKERSRDRDRRDRRRRDRSRSRSRDRRDRRRRDRSHSREKRSKDRDRRSKDRRQSEDKAGSSSNSSSSNVQKDLTKIGIWEDPVRSAASPALQQAQALLSSFIPTNLEEARRNLNALTPAPLVVGNRNGFQNQSETFPPNRGRENWSNNGPVRQGEGRQDFVSRFNRNIPGARNDDTKFNSNPRGPLNNPSFAENPRMSFNRTTRTDGRPNRFENSERPGLLERPPLLDRPNIGERPHSDYLKNSCVQLRPYYGGYGEVRRFFHGIFIHNTGIKFINDDKGKRTGIVYIRLATPEGKDKALLRDGGVLKNQTVDVKHLDDDVFDKTVDRYQPDYNSEQDRNSPERPSFKNKNNSPVFHKPPSQFSCLAVEDLPLFTKEQDMLKIFSDYPLLSILLVNKQRHIIAYIKFNNPEDAKKAQTEKSKHVFDGKQLSIRPCSDEEFAIISHEEPEAEEVIEVEDDEDKEYVTSDCVCLSGLPLKTTDRDVSDFFSDVAIVPSKIHLLNSNLGFTGIAYCEFSSITDAEIALEKSGLPLGSGIVTVDSVPRSEMDIKLGVTSSNNMSMNRAHNLIRPPFFPRGFPRGGPRGMGLMGHRPPMRRFPPPPPGDPTEMAPPGHTVRMENVPYKSVLDEILDFFEGFDVPADNVLRRYNENGTPSGEAKVIFKSAEDAFQAVQERHLGKIRDRTIFLHQC